MIEILGKGWPLLAVASLFGLLVGSFLNVVILRLPARLMHDWRQQSRELLGLDDDGKPVPDMASSAVPPAAQQGAPLEAAASAAAETLVIPTVATGVEAVAAAHDSAVPAAAPATVAQDGASAVPQTIAAPAGTAEEPPPDLVFKGSHCPHCKHALSPLDNIPLLSWLALGGRCRYCQAPISVQYPLVEALSALAALVVVWQFGFTWQAAAGLALTFSLIALSGIDFRTQLLPDEITQPLTWLGLLLSLVPLFVAPGAAIVGASIGYLSLWSVYWGYKKLTGKEGMGYGDFKLMAALGAWMGPMSLLPIILLSSLVGAVIGGALLFARGRDSDTPIPFGPFIAMAGWIQFVWGDSILAWYQQVLLF
jgi:leader peptidase (prepilin peptidase) / N-methyltransferase